MVGYGRLRQAERLDELADAGFLVGVGGHYAENTKTSRLGEDLKCSGHINPKSTFHGR